MITEIFTKVYQKDYLLSFSVKNEGYSTAKKACLTNFRPIKYEWESKNIFKLLDEYSNIKGGK
jgi:hypothetical protein